MTFLPDLIADGLLLGSMYTLMVIGLSLSFGVTRIINFAHGEAVMLGAYGAYWSFTLWHIDPLLALPVLMLLGVVAGFVLFRLAVTRVLDAPELNQILLTFGLGLILQNVALILWTGDERSANPAYTFASFLVDEVPISVARLIGFGVAVLLVGGLFCWLRFTELGRASRALAENRKAATLMGINVPITYALCFGISIALAVATGAVLSFISAVTPFMGFNIVVKGFAIMILGGFGSILGSVVGAFVLAFAETAVAYYVPNGNGWAEGIAFAVLFFVLIVRPQGIAGQAVAN
jgi:branched-chain amino acid transport system permease protein